jgi:hypothetical protein
MTAPVASLCAFVLHSLFAQTPARQYLGGNPHGVIAPAQSAAGITGRYCPVEQEIGAEAMNPYVLDAVFRLFGMRDHIPQNDDFSGGRGESLSPSSTSPLMRVLSAFVAVAAIVALALWAAVWLAIKLL